MKRLLLVTAICASLPVMAQNIATVNGSAITKKELDYTLKTLRIENPSDEQRQSILNELINRDILVQESIKQGFEKKDDVKATIEAARKEILISNLLQEWNEKNKVSDAEIDTAYKTTLKNFEGRKEYKVSHILVKDEEKAKSLFNDINAKKVSFTDAAKKDSIDPSSAKNGGDLGWSNLDIYIPEFSQAVLAAKKGEITEPVKSQYGYHIIKVEDDRPVTPPTLEEAKPELTRLLTQKKLFDYVESLRQKAKVTINDK
ncbi:peptidylprolyl isomerase [Pelistega sp. NLN82]|uniref:peptidylprolyl isomerase n=1 Tax=Pelistega ratti TaxID=2652177 RepID=A0A6L9Y6X5_9BURK|nr:peptidylprolyl isomerase [Pelistega ratti]NEN76113.1 peptidylprolyl isomerase [Pelistega ratti]